ncbi:MULTISPECIES: DUF262 domain-containing protein [unclassified Kaistella]|uniref:DUF262 domain-containing protein n=1 Tax=unclassified Kaistella TaxID=2762626 RepID=UPI0027372EE9|nr:MULTISPECIES: DUF262 domain-containing protein [unclassified Kaistella]MDP2452973.1 DUF262 domain-containing protein [Kaistella sp. SH11-4b]MDP2455882.1 DUF262 domain-containing protein [Kaistella sp. SH40-3]MDP2458786.1 DUF262 domain-containing protein [Kaistella sp. SH19-2b]
MYQVKPETILTFLNDHTIRFPRFQRKQTWKAEQNLKLAISVFKSYPIGVTIINKQAFGSKSTRWLLDGRQRRNALLLMQQNPENIYEWSKKFFGLKNTDQHQDIKDKFWDKIADYLNDSDEDGFQEAKSKAIREGKDEFFFDGKTYAVNSTEVNSNGEYIGEFFEDESLVKEPEMELESNTDYNRSIWGNLDELLFIIQTVHNLTITKSGFTNPFDFRKQINNLTYSTEGNKILSGQKLTTFIGEYLKNNFDNGTPDIDIKSFYDYLISRYPLDAQTAKILHSNIQKNWEHISNSIKVVEIIKNRLQEAIIGIIETQDITATDSQMIFMLINKEGTKLSAVEILSAKPAWNIIIKSPSKNIEEHRRLLYSAINTQVENTVRWDYPATFYDRISALDFLFPKLSYNKNNELEKKLTLGFKILSGIYQKGIKKEDVDKLALNKDISWESDIDTIIDELNIIGKVLGDSPYFKYLKSWNQNFLDITSDAIALNFLFTVYHDFKRKDMPIGNSDKAKIFINNAIILADKLVFEYVTLKWRGSSDSKISQNIKNFSSLPEKFDMVNDQNWLSTIKGINDTFKIDENDISFGISKTLVYHIYSIYSLMGPQDSSVDIDHIIPQSLFNKSNIIDAEIIKNALFNLCPLPSKENSSKTNKSLKHIDDKWLVQQIEKFSNIKYNQFENFSHATKWQDLRDLRRSFFEEDFLFERMQLLN